MQIASMASFVLIAEVSGVNPGDWMALNSELRTGLGKDLRHLEEGPTGMHSMSGTPACDASSSGMARIK